MLVTFVNRTLDVPYADHFFHQEQWFLCTPSDTSAKVILRYATPLSYVFIGLTTRSLSWRRRCFRARSSRNLKLNCVNTGKSGWSKLKDRASLTLEPTKLKGLLCQAKSNMKLVKYLLEFLMSKKWWIRCLRYSKGRYHKLLSKRNNCQR
jgi:hypothetical protein